MIEHGASVNAQTKGTPTHTHTDTHATVPNPTHVYVQVELPHFTELLTVGMLTLCNS